MTSPTAVLTLVASLGLCLLSWLEHERTIRPSFVISTYLFFSILLDLARGRTLWLIGGYHAVSIIFTTTVALRAAMLLLETVGKRRILLPHHNNYTKEATSSPLSRTVFFWLTSLFLKGYKQILKLEDLYPLDTDLKSETLHKALADGWEKGAPVALLGIPLCED
jgi:ATP-binding cassette, subfamily C (CFTR/MRP), member 1